jgi:dTDP-4-amino-4,6-dideoxygalactose transaminase
VIKFLDLNSQYIKIKGEVDAAFQQVIEKSAFIGGEFVAQFEKQFADFVQVPHCVGVANGTDALEIVIEALDLPLGSEILVPGNSFIATSEAVTRSGHKVVFVDAGSDNYCIDIASVRAAITPRTKAIIAVHLYGHPCDMDGLNALAQQFSLAVIEDCAQAHGAQYLGRSVGGLGTIATFSFYPGKNLGAYGDAGAITTHDGALAKRCKMIANHGRIAKYDHEFEGRNSRLDALQAAILSVKLRHLEKWTKQRIEIAEFYLKELAGIDDLILPVRSEWAKQVYHLFVVRTVRRDALKERLAANGIETGIHYPIALPKLAAYAYLGEVDTSTFYAKSDCQLLSLPIGEHMTLDDAAVVATAVRTFFT